MNRLQKTVKIVIMQQAVENNVEYDNKNPAGVKKPMRHEWLERFLDADRLKTGWQY